MISSIRLLLPYFAILVAMGAILSVLASALESSTGWLTYVTTDQGINALVAALALLAGSAASVAVCNEGLNSLALSGLGLRVALVRVALVSVVVLFFALVWLTLGPTGHDDLGLKNFSAAFVSGVCFRRFFATPFYGALGLAWMFPAVLTGSNADWSFLGFALISSGTDRLAAVSLLLVAIAFSILPFRSLGESP